VSHLGGHELTRLNVLSSMVSSILISGRSELRQMALGNPDRKQFASKVKQYKRWLQNKHTDFKHHYLPYIQPLLETLSKSGELILSIDGSVVGKGCMCLMFSVIYKNKAIPIIWKVYKAKKGHLSESAHRDLLSDLSSLIPLDCRVVVTGDGEFDGCDWQADILNLGWDYVVRTGKKVCIRENEWDDFTTGHVSIEKGNFLFFEQIGFTRKDLKTNLLIWHGKGFKEPLFLVTNLDYPEQIQQLYKKRFKIEPFFRDQKSKGFHIHKSGLRNPQRLEKLLIATCLAYLLSIMAGTKASKSKFYHEFARTDGEFLSLFQLGYRFILFLVDIRQWRAFNWKKDFCPDSRYNIEYSFCVPF